MSDPQNNVTMGGPRRVVGNPGVSTGKAGPGLAALIEQMGPSQTDLTPEQIEENKRLVEERLEREAAESRLYLSGEKTLGPQYVADEDVEVVGSGQHELPRHEVQQIEAAAQQVHEIEASPEIDLPLPESLAPGSE